MGGRALPAGALGGGGSDGIVGMSASTRTGQHLQDVGGERGGVRGAEGGDHYSRDEQNEAPVYKRSAATAWGGEGGQPQGACSSSSSMGKG